MTTQRVHIQRTFGTRTSRYLWFQHGYWILCCQGFRTPLSDLDLVRYRGSGCPLSKMLHPLKLLLRTVVTVHNQQARGWSSCIERVLSFPLSRSELQPVHKQLR
jgi:hypothetical protein